MGSYSISQEELDQLWSVVDELETSSRPLPDFEPTSEVNSLSNEELGDHLVKIGFVYGHYNGLVSSAEKLQTGLKKMEKDAEDEESIAQIRALDRALTVILSRATRFQKIWSAYKDMFSRTVEVRTDHQRVRNPSPKPMRPGGSGIVRRDG